MLGIIDYGMGNLTSVYNSLKVIGVDSFISNDINKLYEADKLILPGVGAFNDAMTYLNNTNLGDFIKEAVSKKTPLLGICLGMQLLFQKSYENGCHNGLGILSGEVIPLGVRLKVPHMGWNDLLITKEQPLFNGLGNKPYVYFVHSYHVSTNENLVSAYVEYEKKIPIAVQSGNVYGVQFHPEKSGDVGLTILSNFCNMDK